MSIKIGDIVSVKKDGRLVKVKKVCTNPPSIEGLELWSGKFRCVDVGDVTKYPSSITNQQRSFNFERNSIKDQINIIKRCPKCNSEWNISKSPFSGEVWKDCLKCNMKEEDIING